MSPNQSELRRILRTAEHPEVKLLLDKKVYRISAAEALRLAFGSEHEWCGSKRRVRAIRKMDKPPAWQECYRTVSAPALQPSIEWCRSRRTDYR